MILHLDRLFKPASDLKEVQYESFVFSGGEPHIKILTNNIGDRACITHRINSFNDLGMLIIAVDALRRCNVKYIEAYIPYFPGARQDRVMVAGEPLSAKVYADIINNLRLDLVTIYDVHSDVVPALLNNCRSLDNHAFVADVVKGLPSDLMLVSPDAGALKKVYKLSSALVEYEVLECGKTRDVSTGALSGFKVPAEDLDGKPCLIVDDICDGGGTFIGLAKELKAKNSGDLYLAVSHGIFSKGIQILSPYFKRIFTTNSIANIDDNQLTQIALEYKF